MYNPTMTDPIRAELKTQNIAELKTPEEVSAFMKTAPQSAVILINSVCGCAAGVARPGLYRSLQTTKDTQPNYLPKNVVSVFAGVDKEATEAMREHLPGVTPSSPSFAFFREGQLVHFLGRESIEGADEELLAQSFSLIYKKYFGETVEENAYTPDPFALLERTPEELTAQMKAGTATLFDCRDPEAFSEESIDGAKLLDDTTAEEIVTTWDKDKDFTIYCVAGPTSLRAALYFRQNGFKNVRLLSGGITRWKDFSQPQS